MNHKPHFQFFAVVILIVALLLPFVAMAQEANPDISPATLAVDRLEERVLVEAPAWTALSTFWRSYMAWHRLEQRAIAEADYWTAFSQFWGR